MLSTPGNPGCKFSCCAYAGYVPEEDFQKYESMHAQATLPAELRELAPAVVNTSFGSKEPEGDRSDGTLFDGT